MAAPQPALTAASWTDAEYGSATLTAGHIDPPTDVRCEVVDNILIDGVLQQALHFSWTAPTEPSLPPGRYKLVLSGAGIINPVEGTFWSNGPRTELYIGSRAILNLGESTATVYSTLGPWESGPSTTTAEAFFLNVVGLGVLVDCD